MDKYQRRWKATCPVWWQLCILVTTIQIGLGPLGKEKNKYAAPAVAVENAVHHTGACPPCRQCPMLTTSKQENTAVSKGQVTRETPLGSILYNISTDPSILTILETGTLDGTGATKCILDGIVKSGSGQLVTVEAMKESYELAVHNLVGLPVKVLWGSPMDPSYMPSKEEVRQMIAQAQGADKGFQFPSESSWGPWWDGEQALLKEHEIGLLGPLCHKYRQSGKLDNDKVVEYSFDLMLLDAGEFMGWAEFQLAVTRCQPRYLALHDTQAFKHWFSVQELLKDNSGYEPFDIGHDNGGTGHAVFKRVM